MIEIAPLERLKIDDPELDGSAGTNRAPANEHDQIVSTDIEAAFKFLKRYEHKPTTLRSYTKEIERLIMWAVIAKRKPMSSLNGDDMNEYMGFLEDPQPIELWGSRNRKFPRSSDEWRPFLITEKTIQDPRNKARKIIKLSCGLGPSSCLVARATINSFFAWLVEYGYVIRNPVTHTRAKKKQIQEKEQKISGQKVERYLDKEMLDAFSEAIEAMQKETHTQIEHYERAKFILALMLYIAPRPSEIAKGKMNSFKITGKQWWWHVIGKGAKAAKVPVHENMVKALVRYRTFLGLTPLPLGDDASPLLRAASDGHAITDRQLNYILKNLFRKAAVLLQQKAIEQTDIIVRAQFQTRAAKILKASAHWGRHTSITFQIRSGVDRSLVQKNARHADARTTDHYTHADEEHWHNETQKLKY